MTILATIGRAADVVLIAILVAQLVMGLRLSQTIFLCLRHRRSGMAREKAALAQPLPADDALPAVLVQIPTYNEGALVQRVLSAVTALDWPRDRLQIQLLDDSTDASAEIARATIAEFRRNGHDVVLLQRRDRTGFKAGALKLGLACTSQPFIAMFDADYIPEPDFLRRCMGPLLAEANLAFVQARCDFLNAEQNRLTRAQAVILESHFAGEQATRSWAGQFLPFNGTCGIWRRAAIDAAGGWHGDTLTEDLDLSFRAQMKGWSTLYLVSIAVPGELPDTLPAWDAQQRRWNKGYAQTTRKLLPGIWRSGLPLRRKCGATLHLVGCVYGPLFLAVNVVWNLDLVLGTMTYSVVLPLCALGFLQGSAGAMSLAKLSDSLIRSGPAARSRREKRLGISLYTLLLHARAGALTTRGVIDGLFGRASSFVRTPKRSSDLAGLSGKGTTGNAGTAPEVPSQAWIAPHNVEAPPASPLRQTS